MSGTDTDRRFVLTRENDYVRVVWNEKVTVSEQDARDLVQQLEEMNPGRCDPMLVILNSMVSVNAPAQALFADHLNVAALALVGPSAVDRMIAAFFNGVHCPRYPTRYFADPKAALQWLLTPGHEIPET
jgi:hypothetical protein